MGILALGAAPAAARNPEVSMVIFTLENCRYCKRLMQEQVTPLKRDPTLNWLKILPVDMMGDTPVTLAGGMHATGRELVRRFDVAIAPTVIFLNAEGKPAASPLIGYGSPDFYGAYLDERLKELAPNSAKKTAIPAESPH